MLGTLFRGNDERRQADADLRELMAEVREEREAVRDERAALRAQAEQSASLASRLSTLDKAVGELSSKSESAVRRLDKLAAAVEVFEQRLRCADELGERLTEVSRQAGEAARASKALTDPDGPLQQNRKTLDELGAQVRDVQATLSLVRKDSAELSQAQAELRQSGSEAQRSLTAFISTKKDFADLQQIGGDLRRDVQTAQQAADEARTSSATVMNSLGEMSRRLDAVMQLQDLSKEVERRVSALHLLAIYYSIAANRLGMSPPAPPPPPDEPVLTDRQIDCLQWMREGLTPGAVADKLGIKEHTVNEHLQEARRRLHVRTTASAVIEAINRKLISL